MMNQSKGLSRVSSVNSEMNDFTETKEGEKIYNVLHNKIFFLYFATC